MTQSTRRTSSTTAKEDIEYWRGATDECLKNMQKSMSDVKEIVNSIKQDFAKLSNELSAWRSQTEERLEHGSTRFDMQEDRIKTAETRLNQLEKINKVNGNGKEKHGFGSWDWFRDEIIMPVIKWAILTGAAALLYVVAKRIVEM